MRADSEAAVLRQQHTDATDSRRERLRFLAAPTDVSRGGKVHGGVMRWLDEATPSGRRPTV